jgi:integrase
MKTARRNPKPVHVPLHATLRTMLTETRTASGGDYVLPETASLYLRDNSALCKVIQHHFAGCGVRTQNPGTILVAAKAADRKGKTVVTRKRAAVEVGFHSLRHTFVSLCRESNAPLAVVESIVGHSNPAMTRHYTHTGEAAAIAAVTALPSVIATP